MYQLNKDSITGQDKNCITRLLDMASIPFDPANTDYQQYLAWLDGYEMVNGKSEKTSDSNTPLPAGDAT